MAYEPLKQDTQEQYLKIWTHFAVGHYSQRQLAKLFECSEDTVANAIQWGANSSTKFHPFILAEAAKEALEIRLRELNNDILRVKESNPINWNAVTGLYKIIHETEQVLWKFQAIVRDADIVQVEAPVDASFERVRIFRNAVDGLGMTSEERNTVADIIDACVKRRVKQ